MDRVHDRLVKCFGAVFPQLSPEQISCASMDTTGNWDSVATITLLTVIEEEFGVQFQPEDLERLVSFSKIYEYLKHLSPAIEH